VSINKYENQVNKVLISNEKTELKEYIDEIRDCTFDTENMSKIARFLDLIFCGQKEIFKDDKNSAVFYYDNNSISFNKVETDLELQNIVDKYYL
jgi:hypothetical protein